MPRYCIDIRGYFGTSEDPDGIDLPDIAAAKAAALKIAGALVEGWAGLQPEYSSEIVIEIVGADLRPVHSILCSEIANVSRR